jgi:hypothetical protein
VTIFEHSFTLIGLVLGLALTHVLSEFVRAVREYGFSALGLLTPLLALFAIVDIATFWGILWEIRSHMKAIGLVTGFGILLSSLYYIAACYIFPSPRDHWPDLDTYYMKYRRVVLTMIFLCFAAVVAFASLERGYFIKDPVGRAYMAILLLTIIAPWRWLNAVGLIALIVIDVLAFATFI